MLFKVLVVCAWPGSRALGASGLRERAAGRADPRRRWRRRRGRYRRLPALRLPRQPCSAPRRRPRRDGAGRPRRGPRRCISGRFVSLDVELDGLAREGAVRITAAARRRRDVDGDGPRAPPAARRRRPPAVALMVPPRGSDASHCLAFCFSGGGGRRVELLRRATSTTYFARHLVASRGSWLPCSSLNPKMPRRGGPFSTRYRCDAPCYERCLSGAAFAPLWAGCGGPSWSPAPAGSRQPSPPAAPQLAR